MAVMQIGLASTFRALVQDLERRGLIHIVTDDVFCVTHLFISELGLAVLNKRLPPELQPANFSAIRRGARVSRSVWGQ